MTVASIERRHKRSKDILKSGNGGTGWDTFCSASVIKETASTHEAVIATEQLVKSIHDRQPDLSIQDAPPRSEDADADALPSSEDPGAGRGDQLARRGDDDQLAPAAQQKPRKRARSAFEFFL